jgi:hypothetical protein
MKFHEWETRYQMYKKKYPEIKVNWKHFYEELVESGRLAGQLSSGDGWTLLMEKFWYEESRPYYKVWPGIQKSLTRVSLDCSMRLLPLPKNKVIAIRLSEGEELDFGRTKVPSLIGACIESLDQQKIDLMMILKLPQFNSVLPGMLVCTTLTGTHGTIQEEIEERFSQEVQLATTEFPSSLMQWDQEQLVGFKRAYKLFISLLLLMDDPSFIKPEVLASDREEFSRTKDEKLVEKAKRHGVVGWNVGEEYETIPHLRRPHFGLRWTGEGRQIPKIVPVKGSIVHRDKLTRVPTGYITPEDVEVESD